MKQRGGDIQDDFNDCGGPSATTRHIVNREGLLIGDEQDGMKCIDVEKKEGEESVVIQCGRTH